MDHRGISGGQKPGQHLLSEGTFVLEEEIQISF